MTLTENEWSEAVSEDWKTKVVSTQLMLLEKRID